jgi:hypothetical protein
VIVESCQCTLVFPLHISTNSGSRFSSSVTIAWLQSRCCFARLGCERRTKERVTAELCTASCREAGLGGIHMPHMHRLLCIGGMLTLLPSLAAHCAASCVRLPQDLAIEGPLLLLLLGETVLYKCLLGTFTPVLVFRTVRSFAVQGLLPLGETVLYKCLLGTFTLCTARFVLVRGLAAAARRDCTVLVPAGHVHTPRRMSCSSTIGLMYRCCIALRTAASTSLCPHFERSNVTYFFIASPALRRARARGPCCLHVHSRVRVQHVAHAQPSGTRSDRTRGWYSCGCTTWPWPSPSWTT